MKVMGGWGGWGLTKVSVFSFISFDHFSNEKKIDCCNTFLCCLIAENWVGGGAGFKYFYHSKNMINKNSCVR